MFETQIIFAFALFALGLYGVSSGRDFLRLFFALEMLLNAVIMMLAIGAHYLGLANNIPLAYMIMVIATLEAAAGILIFASANKINNVTIPDTLTGEEVA
jgi:NADH:ubiquinone oxidoreductase subunit K